MARSWSGLDGLDMVKEVTCPEMYPWQGDAGTKWVSSSPHIAKPNGGIEGGIKMVAYDFGIKRNILRHLASYGAAVTVVPADTPANEVLKLKPDAVFLSNGPGDPEGLPYAVDAVRGLLESGVPILGICLGHQLIGMAVGGKKVRLKFGHHAGNHPVKDLRTGKVQITAQNHNYCIEAESLDPATVEVTHLSLNDNSLEGLRLRNRLVMSVQYHPEAAPGPHDAVPVFDAFFSELHGKRDA
jgi:carbamoyl-phosphate synthase small subunit